MNIGALLEILMPWEGKCRLPYKLFENLAYIACVSVQTECHVYTRVFGRKKNNDQPPQPPPFQNMTKGGKCRHLNVINSFKSHVCGMQCGQQGQPAGLDPVPPLPRGYINCWISMYFWPYNVQKNRTFDSWRTPYGKFWIGYFCTLFLSKIKD